jgi:hypothetical protein
VCFPKTTIVYLEKKCFVPEFTLWITDSTAWTTWEKEIVISEPERDVGSILCYRLGVIQLNGTFIPLREKQNAKIMRVLKLLEADPSAICGAVGEAANICVLCSKMFDNPGALQNGYHQSCGKNLRWATAKRKAK